MDCIWAERKGFQVYSQSIDSKSFELETVFITVVPLVSILNITFYTLHLKQSLIKYTPVPCHNIFKISVQRVTSLHTSYALIGLI